MKEIFCRLHGNKFLAQCRSVLAEEKGPRASVLGVKLDGEKRLVIMCTPRWQLVWTAYIPINYRKCMTETRQQLQTGCNEVLIKIYELQRLQTSSDPLTCSCFPITCNDNQYKLPQINWKFQFIADFDACGANLNLQHWKLKRHVCYFSNVIRLV